MEWLGAIFLLLIALVGAFQVMMLWKSRQLEGCRLPDWPFADAAERLQEQRMLLYFHSPRCAPCRRMAPIVEELVAEGRALALDISSAPEIARRFNVRATPTTLLVERGTIVKVLLGFQSRERLRELLN
ncbi:MAG: thioredoxin family protein [Chromatiaceae bacterium]|nr:thioredoxin family protein [Chromatiaceae bacterium]